MTLSRGHVQFAKLFRLLVLDRGDLQGVNHPQLEVDRVAPGLDKVWDRVRLQGLHVEHVVPEVEVIPHVDEKGGDPLRERVGRGGLGGVPEEGAEDVAIGEDVISRAGASVNS